MSTMVYYQVIHTILQMDKPWSYICRSYFLRLQCCKSRFFEDSTDNCIIVPTIAFQYRESLVPRISRGCFQGSPSGEVGGTTCFLRTAIFRIHLPRPVHSNIGFPTSSQSYKVPRPTHSPTNSQSYSIHFRDQPSLMLPRLPTLRSFELAFSPWINSSKIFYKSFFYKQILHLLLEA